MRNIIARIQAFLDKPAVRKAWTDVWTPAAATIFAAIPTYLVLPADVGWKAAAAAFVGYATNIIINSFRRSWAMNREAIAEEAVEQGESYFSAWPFTQILEVAKDAGIELNVGQLHEALEKRLAYELGKMYPPESRGDI